MFVSAEIVAVVLSAVGIVLTLGTSMFLGFAWRVRRIDEVDRRLGARIDEIDRRLGERIDEIDRRLGERIDEIDRRLGERVDEVDRRLGARIKEIDRGLGARIDGLTHEVTEVKIAVARLEGPVPHLLTRTR